MTAAQIVRPHGVRGEVAAEILTDFPDRLTRLTSVELWDGRSAPRRIAVRKCWLSHSRGGQAIFHFAACDSVDAAKKLVGLEVQIPFSDRVQLPEGSYYISDLVGCEVRDKGGAELAACATSKSTAKTFPAHRSSVVDASQGEILIPLAQEICVNVNTAAHRIDVVLPEGLLDLNTK